jgi:hypothetical protein
VFGTTGGESRGLLSSGVLVSLACLACGCDLFRPPAAAPPPGASTTKPEMRAEPLLIQQAKAYPELASGAFVSLADFEDVPGRELGLAQIDRFRLAPADDPNARRRVVHVTRTGVGAMEVLLPPRSELVFADLPLHDFRPYTLLSLAVYSDTLRDDAQVALGSEKGNWLCHTMLLKPGWNTLLIDIQHLSEAPHFDASAVKSIDLALAEAAGPARIYLDDVLLIENSRQIQPAPEGMRLSKIGLDYRLDLPGRRQPIALAQSPSGLWRLGEAQGLLRLSAPGKAFPPGGEDLTLLGQRRLGEAEVLEHNSVRVRLASTWYFPARGGEWASPAVRQVRWEYTFYGDGRWVVCAELNNAGGEAIEGAGLLMPEAAAWTGDGEPAKEKLVKDLGGTVGRWTCLLAPGGLHRQAELANYAKPPALTPTLHAPGARADGDADRDGFDETQGCYYLRAKAGQCRFTVPAAVPPLVAPVFRVKGGWKGEVHVSSDGSSVRNVARLEDGSVLFQLPGPIERPASVEVMGEVSPLEP